jgi:uncharacterized protein YkwD
MKWSCPFARKPKLALAFAFMLIAIAPSDYQGILRAQVTGFAQPDGPVGMEREIFGLINEHRRDKGLAPLRWSQLESSLATKHSSGMASGRVPFSHDGFQKRIQEISKQLGPVSASAENVAYGPSQARELVSLWLNSPEHRRNIEGDYALTGLGHARSAAGAYYYTEIFTR